MKELTMQDLVAFCKTTGLIYPGSEIYGGLANSWDYGPLGVELKNNIKAAWWRRFVQQEPNNVGLDSAIIANPKIWEASGHLAGFTDPLMDCRACKSRHRADKLIEEWVAAQEKKGKKVDAKSSEAMSDAEMEEFIKQNKIACPVCGKTGEFTPIRKFNLMFKTFIGVTEDSKSTVYLRPETCACIFTNFKNVLRSSRAKLPMGICQIGKGDLCQQQSMILRKLPECRFQQSQRHLMTAIRYRRKQRKEYRRVPTAWDISQMQGQMES